MATDLKRMREIASLVAASGNRRLCPVDSLELAVLLIQAAGEIKALRAGHSADEKVLREGWALFPSEDAEYCSPDGSLTIAVHKNEEAARWWMGRRQGMCVARVRVTEMPNG
jgi:hypothetical protein